MFAAMTRVRPRTDAMHNGRTLGLVFMLLAMTACVTVNIYFPAAAAESVARDIAKDVLGTEAEPPAEGGASEPGASNGAPGGGVQLAALELAALPVGDILVPERKVQTQGQAEAEVYAQASGQADINVNTPAINALRASMRQRNAQLVPYYRSGAIGFGSDALIAIRDQSAIPLKDRQRVKKLVADENQDRNALYREIAKANGHPEWEQDIRETFARAWVSESPGGYWYQDASGSWRQK
jgi:hypothetical protein